jgi:hypothetical protein
MQGWEGMEGHRGERRYMISTTYTVYCTHQRRKTIIATLCQKNIKNLFHSKTVEDYYNTGKTFMVEKNKIQNLSDRMVIDAICNNLAVYIF